MSKLFHHYQHLSRTAAMLLILLLTMTAQTAWAQTNYTVTLSSGDGTGDDIPISSAVAANVAESQSAASKGQFWWEGSGDDRKLLFISPDCPTSFTAPSDKMFAKWSIGNPGTILEITANMTLTAVWAGVGYQITKNSIIYEITSMSPNKEVKVASFRGSADVEIPATVTSMGQSFSVTSIGNNAFQGIINLNSVTIPTSVTSIGHFAFASCKELTSITIPASVTSIGDGAFYDSPKLSSVTIKCNPTIGESAFPDATTVTMNLTANGPVDGAYWMTFYNKNYHFKADENTKVYKAKISGNSLALTEVTDRIVTAGNAVILKSTGNPVMTKNSTESSDGYADGTNELQGVNEPTDIPANCYTLSRGADGTGALGFYQYKSDNTINGGKLAANKAYLIYTGATSRGFIGFGEDEATGIREMAVPASDTSHPGAGSKEWYSIDGRRLSGLPTQKGIYVRNGKKMIIK